METTLKNTTVNFSSSKLSLTEADAEIISITQQFVASSMSTCDNNSLKTPSKENMIAVFPCHASPKETDPVILNSATECDNTCDHPSMSANISLETPLKNDTMTLFSYNSPPNKSGEKMKNLVTISCSNNSPFPSTAVNSSGTSELELICKDMNISKTESDKDVSVGNVTTLPTSQEQEPLIQISASTNNSASKPIESNPVKNNVSQANTLALKSLQTAAGASNIIICDLQQAKWNESSVGILPLSKISSSQLQLDSVVVSSSSNTSNEIKQSK